MRWLILNPMRCVLKLMNTMPTNLTFQLGDIFSISCDKIEVTARHPVGPHRNLEICCVPGGNPPVLAQWQGMCKGAVLVRLSWEVS